jgi:sugar/nucleoside kinase (ribokinase family)
MSFSKYADLLGIADYYTPNRKEAARLTGCDDPYRAAEALRAYFDRVVVKLDKDGCIGADESGTFLVPSVDTFRHVDSTGAGDAFLAGFCYGLFYDHNLRDCITFGNITGGKAVTAVGALSAYVDEAQLLSLYRRQKG